MIRTLLFVGAIVLCVPIAWSSKATAERPLALQVAQPAPPLQPLKWLKGTPITRFEKGRVYVVEFWATWCGPCRKSMPHLTQLAAEYSGRATFVGVSILEKDDVTVASVAKFVEKMGAQIGYATAMDDPKTDAIANAWYRAAGLGGIPSAVIVDQQGRVAWTGGLVPSTGFEQALARVVNGTNDLAANKTHQEQEARNATQRRHRMRVSEAAGMAFIKRDYAGALREADKVIAADPEDEAAVFFTKLSALLHIDESRGRAYAHQKADDAPFLEKLGCPGERYAFCLANNLVGNEGLSPPTYQFALEYFRQATQLNERDLGAWMGLARAYMRLGMREQGIEAQQTTIKIAKESGVDADGVAQFERQLEEYRATP